MATKAKGAGKTKGRAQTQAKALPEVGELVHFRGDRGDIAEGRGRFSPRPSAVSRAAALAGFISGGLITGILVAKEVMPQQQAPGVAWIVLAAFGGGLAGAILIPGLGQAFGDWITDWRQARSTVGQGRKRFAQVKEIMPKLIEDMKTDLQNNPTFREFFVTGRSDLLNVKGKFLSYSPEDYDDLKNKLIVLVNNGYILDVTPGNTPKYRMSEEFTSLVLNS